MKTTFDMVDIVWQRLNGSQLKTEISGGVYKKRPTGSQVEDVVINCLPVNNEDLQQAVLNVNIHVPNITIQANGVQDSSQPNTERLQELAALAIETLSDVWVGDCNYDVQQQGMIEDPEAGDHYVNIRLEFFNINTN
jgi:hypothetical protein